MAIISFILLVYNLIFFRKFYINPYLNSTGETLSTFFPVTLWQGRQWTKFKVPMKDDIYYYYPGCIPFLSTLYPFQIIVSIICKWLKTDYAFRLYQAVTFLHYFLSSLLAYRMFSLWASPSVSLFGAITMAYMAQAIRIQTSCGVYTACWIPGMFIGGWWSAISVAMAILGGYLPILIYILPVALIFSPVYVSIGVLLAIPQIIPFLWYYPKSIRWNQNNKSTSGRFPLWKLIDLFKGDWKDTKVSGTFYPETVVYCGFLIPFLALVSHSRMWIVMAVSLAIASWKAPFRVPSRALYTFCFALVWTAVSGLSNLYLDQTFLYVLILIQSICLLQNSDIYPHYPYSEIQHKPSYYFNDNKHYKIKGFPYFTGYFFENKTEGYTGGFSLKSTCEKLWVTDADGYRKQS